VAEADERRSLLNSSAVMAAGTLVSRLSGFVRSALLATALGRGLHADVFTIANTVPNMLYILLAGGVFNAVLVPQLVRAMKGDPDGGDAFTSRVVTAAATFLFATTVLLVLAAPWLMRLYLDGDFFTTDLESQRESAIMFARYCLPQVFFYGMFVLVGQILNARGKFGPMMWAPIANNVIAVGTLLVYLLVYGPTDDLNGGYTTGQELLLGLGSTLGIAAQLLILVPYVRATGFRFRPRWDLRDSGLGHTVRLGVWTVLFVIVNQIAYTFVVRIASSGTAEAAANGDTGAGYTVYAGAFLIVMVPHSVATVSLGTAMLPRISALAAEGDLAAVGREVARNLRTALSLIVPFAVLLPLISLPVASLVWGYGAAAEDYQAFAPAMASFAPGLVLFTAHYLVLRGFFALERTRTVFYVQCAIAASNIAFAFLFAGRAAAGQTANALALAYGASYLVGVIVSYRLLRQVLGGLQTRPLVGFLARLIAASAVAVGLAYGVGATVLDDMGAGKAGSLVLLNVETGVFLVAVVAVSRLLRIVEVNEIVGLIARRVPRKRRG
jgi:putative peptidoglycan lipid II flippase